MTRINGVFTRTFTLITGILLLVSSPVWASTSPEKIEIPKELASAQEYHHAGPKMVIFIQDIHASVKVQQDIASLIEHLIEKYGLKSVAYEGNEGVIDTEKVFWFPDAKLKKAVSEKFMERLELSGPEFARINSKTPFQLSGMEDIKLYEKNLKLAKSALRVRQETLNVLKEIEDLLIKSFDVAGSKESRKLFELEKQFRENRIGLADYLQGLVEFYPDPEFTVLLQNDKKMKTIESREFFEKLESLRHKAEKVLYKKSLERDLSRSMENVRILKDMVNLTATRDQYHQYSKNPGQFKERYFRNLIHQALSRKEAYAQYEDTLDDLVNVVADFYSLADARDQVMSDRLLKELSTQEAVIFVAGGFHTQGITERLRKENISYVLVQPKFEGREVLAEKIYFNSLAEVSSDIAAESVFSIPANKIPKKTEFNKDPEDAVQNVNEAVLAGAESGEFKVAPELLREIALASGKSLGSSADWAPVLKRSLLIQSPAAGTEMVRTIAMNEVRFARDLQDVEDKALLKFAAVFDAFNMFATMYKEKARWDQDIKSLTAQLSESEFYAFLALLKKMNAQISAEGSFKYDDEYTRLLVNGFAESLRNMPQYASDIEALKAMKPDQLRAVVADIVRYSKAKTGVEQLKKAALDSKLTKAFIKALSEEQFKNALILLAKNRDHALLEKIQKTGANAADEINWTNHLIQGLEPELPQMALTPADAVNAIFILHRDFREAASVIEILDMHAYYRTYAAPLQEKLKEAHRLVKAKFEALKAEENARLLAAKKASPRRETEDDIRTRREWEKEQRRDGNWRPVVPGDDNLMEQVDEEAGFLSAPVPKAQKTGKLSEVLTPLFGKLTNGLTPENLAAQIYKIIGKQKDQKAIDAIVNFVRDAAKKGMSNIPAAKLIKVDKKLQELLANGKSLGQRERTILIQINSNDDVRRYSAEAVRFLSATEHTRVVFVVPEWELKANQEFAELRRKFENRADVVSNKLLSSRDIVELNKYISNRKGDFVLIASYESLEKAAPLDGLVLLAADKIEDKSDLKLKSEEMAKVPSALMDTAWRALAAGSNNIEFLSRTRGLDNGRIFVITSEYLGEWISRLFAEHSYAQQFLSAA